jgi:hypothetical protein
VSIEGLLLFGSAGLGIARSVLVLWA